MYMSQLMWWLQHSRTSSRLQHHNSLQSRTCHSWCDDFNTVALAPETVALAPGYSITTHCSYVHVAADVMTATQSHKLQATASQLIAVMYMSQLMWWLRHSRTSSRNSRTSSRLQHHNSLQLCTCRSWWDDCDTVALAPGYSITTHCSHVHVAADVMTVTQSHKLQATASQLTAVMYMSSLPSAVCFFVSYCDIISYLGLEWYRQCCRYPIPRYSRPVIPILDTDVDTGSDLILATVDSQQPSYLGYLGCRTFPSRTFSSGCNYLNVKENLLIPFLTVTQSLNLTQIYYYYSYS